LSVPPDGKWHDITVRVSGDFVCAWADKAAPDGFPRQGDAGQVTLHANGRVDFDDVEFIVPRHASDSFMYALDKRETDWWREGGEGGEWRDHGGIACILASNWISLIAPQGEGMLWNKRKFGPDLAVAFDIEENTEWFGWDKHESHEHYAEDNVRLALSPDQNCEHGYRLEVNAQDHSTTLLYRDGQVVAKVPQTGNFPIRYVGGHAPYSPRCNRICLLKRGPLLIGVINGKEVLRFTDPNPLAVSRVGIGGYKTHVNFSHIEIRTIKSN
jgi:hypothetical protein